MTRLIRLLFIVGILFAGDRAFAQNSLTDDPLRKNALPAGQRANTLKMEFALIPAGSFNMGSPKNEAGRMECELQHGVRISRDFHLGVYEVTQEQFEAVLGRNPSNLSNTRGITIEVDGKPTKKIPVEQVSWFDAIEFLNEMSARDSVPPHYRVANIERNSDRSIKSATVTVLGGNGYRLPTEAEWEYACRAGTNTPFHFGTKLSGFEANVWEQSPNGGAAGRPIIRCISVVGSYATDKNAFGLFDMHGNVKEWCGDWYDDRTYAQSSRTDPTGPSEGSARVFRGGSWGSSDWCCRSAYRNWRLPDFRDKHLGFRVAWSPTGTGERSP